MSPRIFCTLPSFARIKRSHGKMGDCEQCSALTVYFRAIYFGRYTCILGVVYFGKHTSCGDTVGLIDIKQ